MEKIKIICDSLSDITEEYIEKYDIEFMPLTIILDNKQYRDRLDLSVDEFYYKIRNEKILPKTSQITYMDFYNNFKKFLDEGYKILYISAASTATGTYQSAMMAKNELESEDIKIIDSNTLCFGISVLLIEAGRLRDEGRSLDEIVDSIEKMKDRVYVSFSCDDLDFLSRGGRISGTKAIIGTVLGIKPICVVNNGLVDNVANARGKKNVASKIVEIAKSNGIEDLYDQTVFVGYSDDIKERDKLKEAIDEAFKPKSMEFIKIGSGIGTHGGPGTTGFICLKDEI